MIGEKGVISYGTYGMNPKLYRNGEKTILYNTDKIDENNPNWTLFSQAWVEACKSGYNSHEQALTASFDYTGPLTEAVLMGNAIRSYMLLEPNA